MSTDRVDIPALVRTARSHGIRLEADYRLQIRGECPEWLREALLRWEGLVVQHVQRERRQAEAAGFPRW